MAEIQGVDAVIIATAHREQGDAPGAFTGKLKPKGSLIDVKSMLDLVKVREWGGDFWRL